MFHLRVPVPLFLLLPPNGPIPGGEVKKLQKNIRLAGTIKAICMPTDPLLFHALVCVPLFMDAAGSSAVAQAPL
jgi:hypothetical protein